MRNKTACTVEIENLMVAEARNPRKAPNEALIALFVSFLS